MPYLNCDNTQIYYRKNGAGPPVILVAGMSLDSNVWDHVIWELQTQMLAIAMDLRGSGQSDAPRGDYSIAQMANDVAGLIEHLSLNRPLLVGHSLGGFVVLQTALMRPELVGGLVLLSTSATGKEDLLGTTARGALALSNTVGPLEQIARITAEVGLGSKAKSESSDTVQKFVAMRLARPPRGRGFVGQQRAALKFDLRDKISEIALPTAILHGEEDEIISIKNSVFLASNLSQTVFLRLPRVGHFPQLEVPEIVAREVFKLEERRLLR